MKRHSLLVLAAWTLVLNMACKKIQEAEESLTDSPSMALEVAVSEVGANATASETSGAVGFSGTPTEESYVDPDSAVHASSACSYSTVRSACSNSSTTINWNGCTVGSGSVTLSGGWTETFSGTGANSCTMPVASGGTVTRKSTGSTMSFYLGGSIRTDTNGGTAYDGTSIPSTGISISNSGTSRTITIRGTHRTLVSPTGNTLFDHYLTSSGLNVSGARSTGDRLVSGAVTVYHNLKSYTAVSTFHNVVWGSSNCCYPTGGSITTTFTGSLVDSATMTFSNYCGHATYTDSNETKNVTLTQCN